MKRITSLGYITTGAALALSLLSGCATTLTSAECQSMDWRTVGYEDGVNGRPADRIARHRKSCAKHAIAPDLEAYLAGRELGLREYCSPANGFRAGEDGQQLPSFCPADLNVAFEAAYRDGFHLYELRASLSQAAGSLNAARREQHDNEQRLTKLSDIIVAQETPTAEREKAVTEVKRLSERQGRLKAEIRRLEQEQLLRQRDLDDYLVALNDPR